jgi:hypothetical protein
MADQTKDKSSNECGICDVATSAWPRRAFLKVGGAGLFGLTLSNLFTWQSMFAQEPGKIGKDVSVIVIWLTGGLGQLDSFDMKPSASADIRGEFSPISTNVDGIQICELLPNLAKQADKYTLVRSMTHDQADHGVGQNLMLTGYRMTAAVEYPNYGSVVAKELGWKNNMPPYVIVPDLPPLNYFGPGILGSEYTPFVTGNPNSSSFKIPDLTLPLDVDWSRMEARQRLLKSLEQGFRQVERDPRFEAMDRFSERAYTLMSSPRAREAFDLSKEPAKLRESYGYTLTGQGALLARRMVESGVRFVLISKPFGTFDTHSANFKSLRGELPEVDKATAALLGDLHERGMLKNTIVLVTGEFGRTPKVNSSAGRDHWPKAFSLLVAGGGFKAGHVIGSTDATANEVKDSPFTPEDLAATLYERLGVDYEKVYQTSIGRPLKLVNGGKPIKDLLA